MCGIAAVVGKVEEQEELLRSILAPMEHRGDHPNEMKILDSIALGTNRLAIVDRDNGKQPSSNKTGTVFAIQNGEIFNHSELRTELEGKGHEFVTDSDTETLVHLWEEYGSRMIDRIDSEMFAFVVYDSRQETIFAARDRIGVKPLFYGKDADGILFFASELKALTAVCEEIHEFPPAHYYLNGTFTKYYYLPTQDTNASVEQVERAVLELVEKAVSKRVQTDLPIAVFLSGGVDSSLVMEFARKHNSNVTGLILGFPDSSDYQAAVALCNERGWSYKILEPSIDYKNDIESIVSCVENFDPNIVRHSFANDAISRFAHELGFKVVLTGEGSDEIFAGYNEFLELDISKVNLGCRKLLESMSHGNLSRIDRPAMRHTIEARCPFFDTALVDFALRIPAGLKRGNHNGTEFTKFILRSAAAHVLPESIAYRTKVPFANGAGMDIGVNYKRPDGVLSSLAEEELSNDSFIELQREYPEYGLDTKEKAWYFSMYKKFGYTKFVEGNNRLVVKDTLTEL